LNSVQHQAKAQETSPSETIRNREELEARLGHYLARQSDVVGTTANLAEACAHYVRARARQLRSSPRSSPGATYVILRELLKPVVYPFTGRVHNLRQAWKVLNGEGNVREMQGTIWLFFAHVFAEELVNTHVREAALDAAAQAGWNVAALEEWLRVALEYKAKLHGRAVSVKDLRAREDLLYMPWDDVKVIQKATRRVTSALHEKQRYWSLVTRTEFSDEGGEFSPIEAQRISPLGAHMVPWMDPRRFMTADVCSPLVQKLLALGIPLATGISGVAPRVFHLARVMNCEEGTPLLRSVVSYLLTSKAHSYYEIVASLLGKTAFDQPQYLFDELGTIDWSAFT
jgi:hypothetical protein